MATTVTAVTIPVSFSRQAKTRKPTPPPSIPRKKSSSNSDFKVHTRYKPPRRPISSTPGGGGGGGGDATTYTRLPSLDESSLSTVSEVKLSDSAVAKINDIESSGLVSQEKRKGEVEDGVGSELGISYSVGDVFEGKSSFLEDGKLGFNYSRGDAFEGSLSFSKENDDERGKLGFGYRVGEVFEGSLGSLMVEDEEEEEEEDGDEDGDLSFSYRVGEVFAGKSGSMEVEEGEGGGELGFSYRVGDGFEGKSVSLEEEEDEDMGFVYDYNDDGDDDDDDEEEAEEEEEEEEEERDMKFGSGKIVRGYDSDGNRVTAKLYVAGEDDDDDFDGDTLKFEDGELGKFEGGLEKEQGQVKEKGLPAVMRCFDWAKIYVKAGDGGNGVVAFRREKFVPLGGPSGGDGGRGGNVYVEVDGSMNSLLPFRSSIHFRAGRGGHGQGRKMAGAKGEDVVVKVAPGTVIREAGKEEVLLELLYPGQKALLLPGGRGGRGNASFKTGTNKVPKIAENGEEGPEMWLELELKLVADVGIVGAPNAGKSTLLSVISAAQPNIANYPFTTLLPNLGVVSFDYDATMVVADLPGLLEGAHQGFGLGHEFLRHTERCSALVHVVDGSLEQPEYEFEAVRLELEMFGPQLAEKPYIVAFNKMDLSEAYDKWPLFKERLEACGIQVFPMSAMRRDGTNQVISTAYGLLQKTKAAESDFKGWEDPVNLNHVADKVNKQRQASINEFKITHDSSSSTWHVIGSGLQRFVQMTNWRYLDSERRFQHVLEACGVNKSLMKLGVKEGDTVIVGEMEMVWYDSIESASVSGAKKGLTDSIKRQ